MSDRLDDKVAIVTGGSKGIGRAIALEFANRGADVAIASRGAEVLEAVREEIEQLGRRALAIPTDVGKDEDLEALYSQTVEALGGVDILVNNAAKGDSSGRSQRITREAFTDVMSVNVWAPLRLAQLCRESMKERGGGVVINISSTSGLVADATLGIYPASKAALINLTRCEAKNWARDGIRVVCLSPGVVRTEMATPVVDYFENNPGTNFNIMNQIGEPEDIAAMAAFLASDAGRYCNGVNFVVDGGETAQGIQDSLGS